MLHYETVEDSTLAILRRLMSLDVLKSHYLVGGTALSLQYGHRISIDLDLFSTENFDADIVIKNLTEEFGEAFQYEGGHLKFGIFCFIQNVKVDIVGYPHPLISEPLIKENVRMYDPADIIAMKVQAIFGRGKKKDFWDIAELLKIYSIEDFIEFHQKKYPSQQMLISIPSALTYFSDADESEDPISLKGQTWESVKKFIQGKVNDYLK